MATGTGSQDVAPGRWPPALEPVSPALARIWARPLPLAASTHLRDLEERFLGGQCLYISTPITTGPRLLAWRRANPGHGGDPLGREIRREVTAENIRALGPLRAKISRRLRSDGVIDPTDLDEPGWAQADYHRFWLEVISRYVSTVVLADGWQYSTGCGYEVALAIGRGAELLDSNLEPLNMNHGRDLLGRAAQELELAQLPSEGAHAALDAIEATGSGVMPAPSAEPRGLKDDVLARLAGSYNVALFASFSPGARPALRHFFSRSPEPAPNELEEVVGRLLSESHESALNIRTFKDIESKSSPFIYGLFTVADIVREVRRLAAEGYYTIVNETIDVHDGGVSGVRLGGVVEFAPDVTPRGVESADVSRMSVTLANQMLSVVYGFPVEVPGGARERIEFSIHPDEVGYRRSHICVWEAEPTPELDIEVNPMWPNDFSRLVGDKTFGLLVAHLAGSRVPYTTVVPRRVAPFSFGERTSTGEWWLRTAPMQQEPGLFTTNRGWADPFRLLAAEDPGAKIAAVLAQESVLPEYSGASMPATHGPDIIEGVRGSGERFMLGEQAPDALPPDVSDAVRTVVAGLSSGLGPVRTEWAFDGNSAWVLQLHRVRDAGSVPLSRGTASSWVEFDPAEGLDILRDLLRRIEGRGTGVVVTRRVGVTSHVGDLLRKAGVAARFVDTAE